MTLPLKAGDEITTGVLYRRIYPHRDYWVDDPSPGRPSGMNVIPDTGEVYVSMELKDPDDSEAQIRRLLSPPDARPGSGRFEIDVETLRELRLAVKYEPEYGDRHFGVSGWEQFGSKELQRVRRKASFRARVIVRPAIASS